jgi:molybdopterin biosynthesis enzyme MoaB
MVLVSCSGRFPLPDIGTSTMQSRALAGLANGTLVCCLPGSTNACRTAWDGILAEQLDATVIGRAISFRTSSR